MATPTTASGTPDVDNGLRDSGDMRSLTESGTKVDKFEAIRERVRLHPLASTQELVAMLEFEGMKITPEEVEQVRGESKPTQPR